MARACSVIVDQRSRIPAHSKVSHGGLRYHEGIPEARYEGITVELDRVTRGHEP